MPASAMTLADLREYVRTQTQTTAGELPNATIDNYLNEAFNRTIAWENQWPSLEKTWTITQTAGEYTAPVPGDCNVAAITGMISFDQRVRLQLTPHVTAQNVWGEGYRGGYPGYAAFSVWAGEFVFWPNVVHTTDVDYELTGFRFPTDWISEGDAGVPDIDSRLHRALGHYAISLAYAQQEDESLEGTYMMRWQRDVEQIRGAIMEPSQDRPMIFGPHFITPIGNQRY